MADQLKACPICQKNHAKVIHDTGHSYQANWFYFVKCKDCGCKGGSDTYKDKAIAAWNTRAEPVSVPTVQAGDEDKEYIEWMAEQEYLGQIYTSDAHALRWNELKDSVRESWRVEARKILAERAYWHNVYHPSAAPSQPVAGKPSDEQIKVLRNTNMDDDGNLDYIAFARAVLTTANAGKDAK